MRRFRGVTFAGWAIIAVSVVLLAGWVAVSRQTSHLKSWCRSVQIGAPLASVTMPKNGLVSVKQGLWDYGDVSVQFVDGKVAAKAC